MADLAECSPDPDTTNNPTTKTIKEQKHLMTTGFPGCIQLPHPIRHIENSKMIEQKNRKKEQKKIKGP